MRNLKTLLAALAILLLSAWSDPTIAPFKVSGSVTDAADGSLLPGVAVQLQGTKKGVITDLNGRYELEVPDENAVLVFSFIGYKDQRIKVGSRRKIDIALKQDIQSLTEEVIVAVPAESESKAHSSVAIQLRGYTSGVQVTRHSDIFGVQHNTEEYATIHENTFRQTLKNPLSTFSIDVDNASYSNMRRHIQQGQMPPKDAVRVEEMINYFNYDYPQPKGEQPFSVNTEVSDCPWNKEHRLVHIGLQGRKIETDQLPPSNLVFLIDVSGSMNGPDRLPLVKAAFRMLVQELRPQDLVSIVVYAGAAGLVLPPTEGNNKEALLAAIERLQAGGSTAGGAGIQLAYKIAEENFKPEGNNRVILATDGDFNVGVSSNAAMERLVEKKRETGVFLTVLGFGMGNYKDSKMEILANKGNGNYAYIDNLLEAKKVLVNEFGGTLFTIAKDVKLQVEFNPAKVKGYRLIGYENRMLKDEDFKDDKKDAGELGSGHTVTALYEIIPAGTKDSPFLTAMDDLKYQKEGTINPAAYKTDELFTVKFRYKKPDGDKSMLIEKAVFDKQIPLQQTSDNFRFSAAVASFGLLLRDSEFKGNATYESVLEMGKGAKGKDDEGYRAEFLNMVRSMQLVVAQK